MERAKRVPRQGLIDMHLCAFTAGIWTLGCRLSKFRASSWLTSWVIYSGHSASAPFVSWASPYYYVASFNIYMFLHRLSQIVNHLTRMIQTIVLDIVWGGGAIYVDISLKKYSSYTLSLRGHFDWKIAIDWFCGRSYSCATQSHGAGVTARIHSQIWLSYNIDSLHWHSSKSGRREGWVKFRRSPSGEPVP